MNRTLVGDLAEFHFCPTRANRENLLRDGIREGIFVTGNTVIDALKTTVRPDYRFPEPAAEYLGLYGKTSDFGDLPPAGELWAAHDQYHAGPPPDRGGFPPSGACLSGASVPGGAGGGPGPSGHDRIHLIEPLTPDEMHNVMARSAFVMTDSGGLQEEAPALGRPVLVLRRETERPEAVAAGTVLLAGTEEDVIYGHAGRLLTDPAAYRAMAQAVNPYGDGQACRRIVDAILWKRGLRDQPPEEFSAG